MLDTEKCKNRFLEYVNEFDKTNELIFRKIVHTLGVAEYSKEIAISLGLNEEQVNLAYIIGILHDIGRFRQIVETGTYSDRGGINHTEMGLKILFEENMIVEFVDTREYDEIIKDSIGNHSLFKIKDGLDDGVLIFAKIIRDADKLDIFKIFIYDDPVKLGMDSGYKDTDEYTEEVLLAYYEGKQLDRSHLKHLFDWYINMIAFVFDLYYKKSFEILRKEEYLDKIFKIIINKKSYNEKLTNVLFNMKIYIDKYFDNRLLEIK